MSFLRTSLSVMWPPLALLALVIVVWEGMISAFELPAYLLPSPRAVAAAAWRDGGQLLSAMRYTLLAAGAGFFLSLAAGSIIAMAFAQSKIIRRAGYPYAIFLQTVPIVAIAPLLIATCGQNFRTVVLIAVVISLFPIVTNVTAGLLSVDAKLHELFTVLRATRWQRLVKLQLPHALPHAVVGARVSSGLAMVGAIVGEFFAGYGQSVYGLGYLIQYNTGDNLRTDKLFAAVLASAVLGIGIFCAVNLVGAWLLRRHAA